MARTARVVGFESTVRSRRAPREDELSVMTAYARHASHCDTCADPYSVWKRGEQLCDRGHNYARDVARYIYSKGAIPHSLVDRESFGERNEIEVPAGCSVIRNLVKAFDRGLNLQSKKPIISHDPHYYVSDRRAEHVYNERGHGVEIRPSSSRHSRREREHYYHDRPTIVADKRGSLYYLDEEAKSSRKRNGEDPLVIIAEPRRRYNR